METFEQSIIRILNDEAFKLAVIVEEINPKCSVKDTLKIWCDQNNLATMATFDKKIKQLAKNSDLNKCAYKFKRGDLKNTVCGKSTKFEFCSKHKKST